MPPRRGLTSKTVKKREFASSLILLFLVRRNRPILTDARTDARMHAQLWASGRTDARTHALDFEKCVFSKPLPRTKSAKKRVRKNSHAFCHGRAESIPPAFFPAVFYPAVSPQRGLTIYLSKKGKREYLSCCVSPTGADNYQKKGKEKTLA